MEGIHFSAWVNGLSFLLLAPLAYRNFIVKQQFFVGVFSLIYSILFCLVPSLSNVYIGAEMYHPEAIDGVIEQQNVYVIYSVINFMFSLCILFLLVFQKNKQRASASIEDRARLSFLKNGFGLLFILGVVLYIVSTGFKAPTFVELVSLILDSGRMAHFKNDGYSGLMMNLSFYLMSSVTLFFYIDIKTGFNNKVLSFAVLGCLVLVTVLSGARQFLLLALSGAFLSYYTSRKFSPYKFSIYAALGGGLLISWQIIRAWIFSGAINSEYSLFATILSGDISYFYYASLEAIKQHIYNDMYFFGNFYRNLVFIVFPHELTFGLKQADLSSLFAKVFYTGVTFRTGNYPPGFIGLFFLNFGYFGWLLVGIPILFFVNKLGRVKVDGLFYLSFGTTFVFLTLQLFRGTTMGFYQATMLAILVFIMTVVRNFFLEITNKRKA